jgi:hypothetical protein
VKGVIARQPQPPRSGEDGLGHVAVFLKSCSQAFMQL